MILAVGSIVYLTVVLGGGTQNSSQTQGDIFVGTVLNKLFKGTDNGVVVADLDCDGSMNAVTCRAIINSERSGRLEFRYTHNMERQACLSSGDMIRISDDEGKALVERL